MNSIAERIAKFHAVQPDAAGEQHQKLAIIASLEDSIGEPLVQAFFLNVISNSIEYDLARIEVLKILKFWKPPSAELRCRVGRCIAETMTKNDDVLVQQWAAIAARSYVDIAEIFNAASELASDRETNLDVRFNALDAIEKLRTIDADRILGALAKDSRLGKSAQEALNKRNR